MKILKSKTVASVEIAEVEVSRDELEVFETAVTFALKKLSDSEIERLFGATREELEGISEDTEKAISVCQDNKLEPVFA